MIFKIKDHNDSIDKQIKFKKKNKYEIKVKIF